MKLTPDHFSKIIHNFNALRPILVIGDLGVDKYTLGEVKRISPEAPVPVLEVSKEWNKLGLAANVSDNLKSLGVASTISGVTGNDSKADLLESLLEEMDLKTWGLIRDESRHTTYKERITTSSQQICRIDYETKDYISEVICRRLLNRFEDFIPNHSGVILEDYGKGLFSEKLCQEIIYTCQEKKLPVAIDPSRTTPPHWYKGASLLKPNKDEAQIICQSLGYARDKNLKQMATLLIDKLDLDKVIITLGAEGMAMMEKEGKTSFKIIPTVAEEVFDVSGAGDTVIATIMSSLLSGASLEDSAWIANCAAGVVVKKRGTALCSIDELTSYHERVFKKLMSLES